MTTVALEKDPTIKSPKVVIEASQSSLSPKLRELWAYRDLFLFLVWRDVKVRYAQSILGIGWAVIRPLFSMVVFSVVFGRLANISSDGVPYAIFSYAALVPWTYFSSALTGSTSSLLGARAMLTKVYFPRLVLPLTAVLSKLLDFGIALLILFGMMAWFGIPPTLWALALPALVLLMMLAAAGIGMWLTALSIQYRDVSYGLSFGVQLLMYAAPVVYPVSAIPERFRVLYGLNPMAGVIEGFRAALLGTAPMPWDLLVPGAVVAVVLFIGGALYFQRTERIFADVA
jgi:lipopolysaccharide transport system permease protein